MSARIEGELKRAAARRVAIVAAQFNDSIVANLLAAPWTRG